MGILADSNGAQRRPPTAPGAHTVTPAPERSAAPVPAAASADGHAQLRHRRDALAEEVRELHWDLGGLAYEMAIRDHFRLDVLVRRAAALQVRDGELAEVERLLRMEESATAGNCPHCAAPHSRGAVFCWQCGATLMERLSSTALPAHEDTTAVMDALLAAPGASAHHPDE